MGREVAGNGVSISAIGKKVVIIRHFRHTVHMVGAGLTNARAWTRRTVGALVAMTALIGALLVAPAAAAATPAAPTAATAPALATTGDAAATGIVKAADLSKFQPGNIVSDAVFFSSTTMSEAQIQSFLDSKVSSCRSGYTCLKDYYDLTRTTTADAMCGAYSGGTRERASRIIYKVARACGINPQVILVMLQKEQGLVASSAPSSYNYRAAMGQGCPDTAACDTRYYGFFNQVFGGAWQLKRYANPPGTSQFFTWYAPGKTWNVLYHPNRACGTSPVYIQNQATANLYYYTPYQPNAGALRAGYGIGDGCSSYGNRNFFNYFTDWFGSTQVPTNACGVPAGTRTAQKAYVVNTATLNARVAPSTSCTKNVQQLSEGTVLRAVAVNGDWLKVAVEMRELWVHRDYVRYASDTEAACAWPGGVTSAGLVYVVTSTAATTRIVPDSGCGTSTGQLAKGSVVQAIHVNAERTWVRVHAGDTDRWVNRSELRRATTAETRCALPGGVGSAGYQYVVKASGTTARTVPSTACATGRVAISGNTVVQAVEVNKTRDWLKVTTGRGDYWVPRADVVRASADQSCSLSPQTRDVSRGYVVLAEGATAYAVPTTTCAEGTVTIPGETVFTPVGSTVNGDWLLVRYAKADVWLPRSSVRYATDAEVCGPPGESRTAAYTYRVVNPTVMARLAPRTGCDTGATVAAVDTIAVATEVTGDGEWLKLTLPVGPRWVPRADVVRHIAP